MPDTILLLLGSLPAPVEAWALSLFAGLIQLANTCGFFMTLN